MKSVITNEIADGLFSEIEAANIQIWKDAKQVEIKAHFTRGEIVRRYVKQFDLNVNATVALLAERGISERSIQNSLYIFDNHWKGDMETSLAELPEGDNITVRKLLGAPKKEPEPLPECDKSCKRHCK